MPFSVLPLLLGLPLAEDVHHDVEVLLSLRADVETHAPRQEGEAGGADEFLPGSREVVQDALELVQLQLRLRTH